MVVPLAARWVAAACGILLVLTGWQSVIGTLIVPRPVGSWLTRWVDRLVLAVYRTVTRPVTDYVRRDRILATQAAAILVTQLGAWLGIFLAGFTLALWPFPGRSITTALADAGSSIFTLGFAEPRGHDAGRDRLHRGGHRNGRGRAPDRLPADAVRRVQPAGDRGGAARLPGRRAELGAGTARPHALRARLGHVHAQHAARPVPAVGALVVRRRGEPHDVPAPRPLPLAAAVLVVGDRAARPCSTRPRSSSPSRPDRRQPCRPGSACAAGSAA